MNPVLLGLLGAALSFAAGTWYGAGLGEDREYAKRAREDAIVARVSESAQSAAAAEIAKIKPRNVTIRQEMQREVETRTVYRDCRHGLDGLRIVNDALAGIPESAGGGKLPQAHPADR